MEPRRCARAVGGAGNAQTSRKGGHHPRGTDFADGVIVRIRDIRVASSVQCHSGEAIKERGAARAVGSAGNARASGESGYSLCRGIDIRFRRAGGPRRGHRHRAAAGQNAARRFEGDGVDAHRKARDGCAAGLPSAAVHLPQRSHGRRSERHCQGAGLPHAAQLDLAEGVVVGIRDIKIAARIRQDAVGIVEPRRAARAVRAAQVAGRITGKGGHHPGGRDHADGAVIGDKKIAFGIRCDGRGVDKLRRCACAVETPLDTHRSSEGGHRSIGRDLADGVIAAVRHINIAAGIHRHAHGGVELRRTPLCVGIASAEKSVACQGGHHPGRGDLADGVVAGIGHIHIAVAIHRHAIGMVKERRAPLAIGEPLLA